MPASLRCLVPLLLLWLGSSLLLAAVDPPAKGATEMGVLPKGANGKALNLDFETGDLQDWTAEGAAFAGVGRPGGWAGGPFFSPFSLMVPPFSLPYPPSCLLRPVHAWSGMCGMSLVWLHE